MTLHGCCIVTLGFYFAVWCALLTARTDGQSINATKRLIDDLLTTYDRRVRPRRNQSEPVEVNINLVIYSFTEIDEITGLFGAYGNLELIWRDDMLTWKPAQYENIYQIVLPAKDIWFPPIVISNPVSSPVFIEEDQEKARINLRGEVSLFPANVFEVKCDLHATYFPFDKQQCTIWMVTTPFLKEEIKLLAGATNFEQIFIGSATWSFHNSTRNVFLHPNGLLYVAVFSYQIQRKPLFVIITVLLPIIFLSVLNILVFALPAEAGERISFAVTILLALAVFMTLVGDNLPKTSEPFPILGYYIMVLLSISAAMCFVAMLNSIIYCKDENTTPPSCVIGFTKAVLCFSCRFSRSPKKKHRLQKLRPLNVCDPLKVRSMGIVMIHANENRYDRYRQNVDASAQCHQAPAASWKDVSSAVDIVSMVTFLAACVACNAYYLTVMQAQTWEEVTQASRLV